MSLTKIEDHAGEALARLAEQYKNRPNFAALLNAINGQAQDLEDMFFQLLTDRLIDTAVGAQLDVLGKIAGQRRAGQGDTSFRRYIKARLLINRCSGEVPILINIFRLLSDTPDDVTVTQWFPCQIIVEMGGAATDAEAVATFLPILQQAAAGGVRALLVYHESADTSDWFRCAGDEPGAGLDDGTGTVGGQLAGMR